MNYVYILRCNDDSLYTGWTNNLEKRIKAHSEGKGAKYTKARLPVELVYFEEFSHKEAAIVMKKSVHNIETLVYRARKSLKSQLEMEGFIYEEL